MSTPRPGSLSSPDPLNDPDDAPSSVFSSRRVTRSQRSGSFVSLSSSPRKQTFELEVGNQTAPQKLLVTVETNEGNEDTAPSEIRRKLFPSMSPVRRIPSASPSRRMGRTTTTTVPLRDTIEEEDEMDGPRGTTPKRRGRPRKTNGTPIPKTGTKRRAPTPIKRTPRRARMLTQSDSEDDVRSETSFQPTPKASKQSRTPQTSTAERKKNAPKRPPTPRAQPMPSSELGADSNQSSASVTRRGRRRRQALIPDEVLQFADEAAETASISDSLTPSENEMDLVRAPSDSGTDDPFSRDEMDLVQEPSEPAAERPLSKSVQSTANETESDLWMATLSDEDTPRPTRKAKIVPPVQDQAEPEPPEHQTDRVSSPNDAAQGTHSDHEVETSQRGDDDYGYLPEAASDVSSVNEEPAERAPRNDTIAQGEDFSMIFMDSIPSLRADASLAPVDDDELGEETHKIINSTLESLRQSRGHETQTNMEEDELAMQDSEPVETVELEQREVVSSQSVLSPSKGLSPKPLRSAQKRTSSPLRHQVLKLNARQSEVGISYGEDQTPLASSARRPSASHQDFDESNLYEDSFSEIPQDVLDAATPRRPTAVVLDDAEDDMDLLEEPDMEEDEQEALAPREDMGSELDDMMLIGLPGLQDDRQVPESDRDQTQGNGIAAAALLLEGHSGISESDGSHQDQMAPRGELEDVDDRQVPESDHGQSNEQDDMELLEEPETLAFREVSESVQGLQDAQARLPPAEPLLGSPSTSNSAPVLTTSRLPTPDDTPPFAGTQESPDQQPKSAEASQTHQPPPQVASPTLSAIPMDTRTEEVSVSMSSSQQQQQQPHQQIASPERPRPTLEVTPANQLSSPPQESQSVRQEPTVEKSARPTLSPILRAGRALQTVTSDPPSPEVREKQLRSPFRSSGSKEPWPVSSRSQNLQVPQRSSQQPERASQAPSTPVRSTSEDIFGASRNAVQTSFLEALNRSRNASTTRERSASVVSAGSSLRFAPVEDQMSWVADAGPISPNLRGDNTLREASRVSIAGPVPAAGPVEIEEQEDESEELQQEESSEEMEEDEAQDERGEGNRNQDDETDIWEFEAEREPQRPRQQPFGKSSGRIQRRSALASPWTKKSVAEKSAASQPREHQPSGAQGQVHDKLADDLSEEAQSEEMGLPDDEVEVREEPAEQDQVQKAPESAKGGERFNLSSFFSSPAAIPGMLAEKFFTSKPKAPERKENGPPQGFTSVPTSSMFPQAPPIASGAHNQASRGANMFAFSLVRNGHAAPSAAASSRAASEAMGTPTSPLKNFTPRQRQTSYQPSSHAAAQTPPRMQRTHADIAQWQKQALQAGKDSPDFRRPLLRPLPPKNASPTKSSLRSPLKPHTPGRVVEFTSSVLSPMEQAQSRQQMRMPLTAMTFEPLEPAQAPAVAELDKENHETSDISMSDAPPLAKAAPRATLSQSVWTRQHWLLLDEFLQQRRQAPLELDYEHGADKYLGKTVKGQGRSMKLERWHLDCIDAFRAEVGGWDEGILAKRLFALIVGEEKRDQGYGKGSGRVMFH